MTQPSPAERRWELAAAISSIAVFGIGVGLTAPLLSLLLESRGTDTTTIGLNAASAFLGVIAGPLLTPSLVGRLGLRRFLLLFLALDAALFFLLKISDDLVLWFVVRIALGLVGSGIFTATEAWISMLAGDAARGRVIGLYATALSIGFGTGPLLLSLTGLEGWTPFVVNAVLAGLAALPLLPLPPAMRDIGARAGPGPLGMFRRARVVMLTVALFGVFETISLALLPVWGVHVGLAAGAAAAALSAIYFGQVVLQVPIGLLSDRIPRLTALRLCGAAGMAGAALLTLLPGHGFLFYAVLFLWGGLAGGLYPIALSMAGDRFAGAELVAANAALVMAYGLGSLVGPALGGAAMAAWDPHGLPALLVLAFAVLMAATLAVPDPSSRHGR